MADGIEIRPYRPGDETGILASLNTVFREVWGQGYVDRDLAAWRWLYHENPAGHRIQVAVAADGTVAGHYAAVPVRARTPAGSTTFCQIVDSFVHPDYRHGLKRPGLFVHTAAAALQRWSEELGDGLFWGLPVPEAKRISIRFLDYIEWRPVDYLCRELTEGGDTPPDGIEVRRVSVLGSEIGALSEAHLAAKGCSAVRDARYLNWRYARYPVRGRDGYDLYEARRQGEVAGFLVLRARHELLPGACSIAELLLHEGDDTVLDALLAVASARGRARERRLLLAVLPPASSEARALAARGFRAVPSADSVYRSIGLRIAQPGLTVDTLERTWWYCLGDTDLV